MSQKDEIGAVRAKMRCNYVEAKDFGGGKPQMKVQLGAIYGTQGENAAFTTATPSGECWMQIDAGMPAATWFKPGRTYYVTFTEAPPQ